MPDHTQANQCLAAALHGQGRLDDLIAGYRRALTLTPDDDAILYRLGIALQTRGSPGEAEVCYRRALAYRPSHPETRYRLGHLLQSLGRLDEAEACYRLALALRPDWAEAHNNLGIVLHNGGRFDEAITCYDRASALDPEIAEAHNNCGAALQRLGRLDGAEARYHRALALQPDDAGTFANLGTLEHIRGRPDAAIAHYEKALAINPDLVEVHSNLIFNLDLVPGAYATRRQAERRRWNARHAAPLAPPAGHRHANAPDPERRLRIGYVSADFRRHSAFYAFAPVILNHDRERFEPVCYSNCPLEDDHTARLRAAVPEWRAVFDLSDHALSDLIGADAIDILVDLSGHSSNNRLLTFARKPAPIQVTAWGYATGTGLETMDALFSDAVTIPPAERPSLSETVVDLPCVICFQPPPYAPGVRVQAPGVGGVTFGCFNRLLKVGDEVLGLWRELLRRRPEARLVLKDFSLDDPTVRARILAGLTGAGVAAERIDLLGGTPHAEHLAAYQRIDIALDPFPHGGGISSAEALWMGVPVLTMRGAGVPGRVSASILTALGLDDWIAADREAYLGRALALAEAGQSEVLAGLRSDLRARFAASPAGDGATYTRAVEAAYRDLWRRWCASGGHAGISP